jgi:anti-sigma B factor antagonist
MAVVQSVEGAGSWVRIRFAGEIDVDSTDLISSAVAQALVEHGSATVLEVDMQDVTLIDSTGVGVLVSAHRDLAGKGVTLLVTNPVKIVERVLRVTGVYETLTGSGVTLQRRRGGRARS